jgi:AAA family ATP:ADP antiporter
MEFTEIIWKATVKLAFPKKADYMRFMGNYSTMVGFTALIMMLTGSQIISRLGWKAGALMTPATMSILSLPFFAYITLYDLATSRKALLIAVYIGVLQNVLTKATKYSIFDPTKEMTYIPLDAVRLNDFVLSTSELRDAQDSKVKGKAAIDVLGARLGKSGAALAQQGLVMIFGNILSGAPFISVCFYLVMFAWFSAVSSLNHMFHEKSREHDALMESGVE